MPPSDRTWRNLGAREGLYFLVESECGEQIRVSFGDDADRLCAILNSLEESSAFGQQCLQDSYEGAYVEASIIKQERQRAAKLVAACRFAAKWMAENDAHPDDIARVMTLATEYEKEAAHAAK